MDTNAKVACSAEGMSKSFAKDAQTADLHSLMEAMSLSSLRGRYADSHCEASDEAMSLWFVAKREKRPIM